MNDFISQPDPESAQDDILIVDDSLPNLRTLSAMLAEQGYKVRGARDGLTALMIAQGKPPDLILLDIRMPGMDGYQVCRQLKDEAKTRDIPVIFISALDEVVDKVKGFEVGGVDYITKPFQVEEALARVETHLALRRLQKQLQAQNAQLKAAQDELIRQERLAAMGQLTATVAHEIRNPLGTIRASIFAIGDAIERDEMGRIPRALELGERNIVRCDNIIRELLDYTRDKTLRPQPTHIDTWLDEVLDEIQSLSVEHPPPESLICTRELSSGAEIPIDREYLRRAVVNVVDNAIDALQDVREPPQRRTACWTSESNDVREPPQRRTACWTSESNDQASPGNRLTVSTHVVGARLEIRVSDTGPGIPADVQAKIFEPLFSTKTFGVGLGLPIVKNIMKQHSGGVQVNSEAGTGTTVTLWLPMSNRGGD